MKVVTAGKEVLEASTFIVLSDGETFVTLEDESETLTFVLDFQKAPTSTPDIKLEPIDSTSLRIKLVNLDSQRGTTFNEALKIGTFRNRELYFMISLNKIGSEGDFREVTFVTYLGAEVSDGQL